MNNQAYVRALQEQTRAKFRGHENLHSKYTPKYPMGVEREYERAVARYLLLAEVTLKKHMPELMEAIRRERDPDSRHDDDSDFDKFVEDYFHLLVDELFRRAITYNLKAKLQSIVKMLKKQSVAEWEKAVKQTLGIDIVKEYYNGVEFEQLLDQWIENNVNLVKSIPQDILYHMKDIVKQGYQQGSSATQIARDIQRQYGVSKRKAQSLARDQLGKLNSQVTRLQQEDAGIQEYIWRTKKDSRVRQGHKRLEGKKCRWDSPPKDPVTGRRCHPGEDYGCRCTAEPVFHFFNMKIPWQEKRNK